MNLKVFMKKVIFGYRATSKTYLSYLQKRGVSIGKGVEIFRPLKTTIDVQNPHLLSIGDFVQMTGPVTILTHDYSWCVLKRKYGYIYGNQERTTIGNNVFIGWGATILAGSTIGDNVIIGANSLVSGKIESNSVYAGIPAKRIMSLEKYKEKRAERQLEEALNYVKNYEMVKGTVPKEKELDEYFYLFKNKLGKNDDSFNKKVDLMGNRKETLKQLNSHKKMFNSYKDFLSYYHKWKSNG
ncbi:acyltransferase [Limosilactobacillus reuteri]|uniref:acyltransferase n=1 Tax=Limosilactobacillus reuteri TaxID=1598 RepID=UPI000A1E2DCC|nr:acyltransferase [Limosilactobacillus reuteri]